MAVGEWDQRQLCPDGGCVGVIGPDGTCKVCGRAAPNWGDERTRGLIAPPDEGDEDDAGDDDEDDDEANGLHVGDLAGEDDEDDEDDEGEDDDDLAAAAPATERPRPAASGEWGTRRLCSDGACIGVIGADGRCNVCGKVAA